MQGQWAVENRLSRNLARYRVILKWLVLTFSINHPERQARKSISLAPHSTVRAARLSMRVILCNSNGTMAVCLHLQLCPPENIWYLLFLADPP